MGAVSVDLNRKERQYDLMYPLDNPVGVRNIYEHYYKLTARWQDGGDYDAMLLLLDFAQAVEDAELTQKQSDALDYVYMRGLTMEESARELGYAGKQGVSYHVETGILKIAQLQGYDEEVFREKRGH